MHIDLFFNIVEGNKRQTLNRSSAPNCKTAGKLRIYHQRRIYARVNMGHGPVRQILGGGDGKFFEPGSLLCHFMI